MSLQRPLTDRRTKRDAEGDGCFGMFDISFVVYDVLKLVQATGLELWEIRACESVSVYKVYGGLMNELVAMDCVN